MLMNGLLSGGVLFEVIILNLSELIFFIFGKPR